MSFPDTLEIKPLARPPVATVRVPGSKSITNRALVLAALCGIGNGCQLQGALDSEDTQVMIDALRQLGFRVRVNRAESTVQVSRSEPARVIPAREADLFVGNSGTTMRFLTAMVSLGKGRYRLDGVARMRERPIEDLLSALGQLGVRAYSEKQNGFPPVIVEADGINGGQVCIKGDVSSQFLSGLLMVAPLARNDVTIDVKGALVSAPYVDMTLAMMRHFGARVEAGPVRYRVPGRQWYQAENYAIEPDASAASYFFAAAAITGGKISVPGLGNPSLQGDVRFVDILEKMGCEIERGDGYLSVKGKVLRGVDVDMNDVSDTVMTLAAVACFAAWPTTIRNVGHIRHKETDRLAALANELRRIGAEVEERPDGLKIIPGPLHGAEIETYDDHRMAMSLALVGLKVPGIIIRNPGCVAKTYPRFFEDLDLLRS